MDALGCAGAGINLEHAVELEPAIEELEPGLADVLGPLDEVEQAAAETNRPVKRIEFPIGVTDEVKVGLVAATAKSRTRGQRGLGSFNGELETIPSLAFWFFVWSPRDWIFAGLLVHERPAVGQP